MSVHVGVQTQDRRCVVDTWDQLTHLYIATSIVICALCTHCFCCHSHKTWCMQSIGGDMQFTIIRPGGLKTQPATGRGVLTEDNNVCGAIHREDVADLLVTALFSNKTNNKVRFSTTCISC